MTKNLAAAAPLWRSVVCLCTRREMTMQDQDVSTWPGDANWSLQRVLPTLSGQPTATHEWLEWNFNLTFETGLRH
mgnify:CR=1 FL=1